MNFTSVTSISGWAKSGVRYFQGAPEMPYVLKDGMYQYFSFRNGVYTLVMTSEQDLNEKEN